MPKKDVIARTVVLIIALANQILVMFNKNPLPFSDEEIFAGVTAIFTVVAALWSWWKNNSFTQEAKEADRYMNELKGKNK